ncbi:Mut7-C RNAse domain-containing protein [Streptomyces apocyni]|uniref:Mut7-C RNAse domain-containing protein n=1 Tax=Streptomyces apocyni TaxID=2654677 RepID=UPI0012EA3AAB|nr:Mut7-C RNAse domain-containing protein [Streptomyces apocyni]
MAGTGLRLRFAEELRLFLAPRYRSAAPFSAPYDGASSLGHVVQSLGVPLPEVGRLLADGQEVPDSHRPRGGELIDVEAVPRPQRLPETGLLLDVHLGTLARWLRLLGLDTEYRNDLDDDTLLARANTDRRVLLTQDRGLLKRRALWYGCYVRGAGPDEQLADVLDRFAPRLAPWTRCMACNGRLVVATKDEVEPLLQPGTRRTYDVFSRCLSCGRAYWRGAHGGRLAALVDRAQETVAARERRTGE